MLFNLIFTPIAFADDLLFVVVAPTEDAIERAAENAVEMVKVWLETKGLTLVLDKTVVVVMGDTRRLRQIAIRIAGQEIEEVPAAKYLGAWLDKRRSFVKHVAEAVDKAERMVIALMRIMGNVTRPGTKKRRISGQVNASILLYGALVWAKAFQKKRTCKKILCQQRRVSLQIIAGYRTVSLEAALVIADTPPLDLVVQ